ncbi:class I SAM-dependent methyltransferase [Patescibacteria group bacterium]|nr:class I SAM-dependent methyltransferase [Patescibacteria group bacterium]MBU1075211.1 class I SAM-dependent methyltransferase [Patescibacteria group bacterium]MBU1951771.1 class I SAM-dependent methyltransferase [Patescibacteria group bacterium]MBU2229306.1 class I SAM-dependent methyltransferase [Patescibacteria group bacterium]MBU2235734.1 class I SAM-dependent methyltransferase [Patescibacteria group bacterium]
MTEKFLPNSELWKEYKPTARGAQEYLEDFGLTLKDLRGKKILDIGSGLNEFANDLRDENLDITSIDPFYGLSKEEQEELYKNGYEDGEERLTELLDKLKSGNRSSKLVAGRSEDMPFASGSFDLVISHYGLPFYAEDGEKLKQFFLELSRILNEGGEAKLYPSYIKSDTDETTELSREKIEVFENILKELEDQEFEVDRTNNNIILRKPKTNT